MARRASPHGVEPEYWQGRAVYLEAECSRLREENAQLREENARLRAENVALLERVAKLEAQLEALRAEVLNLTHKLYGRRSEQSSPAKGAGDDGQELPRPGRRGQQPGTPGHGRRRYLDLPAREVIHDVPEADRHCPRCGLPYHPFPGDEVSEQIDWQVRVERVVHRRKRYHQTCRCSGVPAIITAPPPPKVMAKGLFTAGFIARLLIEKFVLSRPLHRLGAAMRMEGVELAPGTLVGVLRQMAGLLVPLYAAIRARCVAAEVWQADETGWKVFAEVEGKASHRWWLWVFASADTAVFVLDPARSAAVPKAFFGTSDDQAARGLLGSDFYRVYQALGEGILSFFCWAHLRRHFLEAARGYPSLQPWAEGWRERIATLYQLHQARQALPPGDPAYLEADAKLGRFVQVMETDWRTQQDDPTLAPAGCDVLKTMERHWQGLTRFLEHPQLPLDNNEVERLLRTPVVGRKNFYGSGAPWSGELAAMVWTITATVSKAQLNPLLYLGDFLEACAQAGGQPLTGQALDRFLPWSMSPADRSAWARGP